VRASLLVGLLSTCVFLSDALAGQPSVGPSGDMIEFLGTYETSHGKELDPMALADDAVARQMPKKAAKPVNKPKRKKKCKGRRL
jgi:hypothetical protein